MSNFDKTFFKKYLAEWQEIKKVFHKHPIKILDDIILIMGLGVLIPTFLYYNSYLIQQYIEFDYFKMYLFWLYIIIIYKIMDWYFDCLILTQSWVTKLEWSLLKSNSSSVDYKHLEWIEVDKSGILDAILKKWDVKILKFWAEQMIFDDAYKPYIIVNHIEKIASEINSKKLPSKFDLMMDTLWAIVENYLWKTGEEKVSEVAWQEKRDLIKKEKSSKELSQEFLKNIEKENGTIDLR